MGLEFCLIDFHYKKYYKKIFLCIGLLFIDVYSIYMQIYILCYQKDILNFIIVLLNTNILLIAYIVYVMKMA